MWTEYGPKRMRAHDELHKRGQTWRHLLSRSGLICGLNAEIHSIQNISQTTNLRLSKSMCFVILFIYSSKQTAALVAFESQLDLMMFTNVLLNRIQMWLSDSNVFKIFNSSFKYSVVRQSTSKQFILYITITRDGHFQGDGIIMEAYSVLLYRKRPSGNQLDQCQPRNNW